jgi:hypothetical protein
MGRGDCGKLRDIPRLSLLEGRAESSWQGVGLCKRLVNRERRYELELERKGLNRGGQEGGVLQC